MTKAVLYPKTMRTYTLPDGRKWPSVTQVISDCSDKPALVQWAANTAVDYAKMKLSESKVNGKVGWYYIETVLAEAKREFRKLSEEALSIGSEVHAAIESYLLSGGTAEPQVEREEALSAFVAFLEWVDTVQLEVMETEQRVLGDFYAGTLDIKAKINGNITILDLKTSKAIYPEYRYQIAAYRATQTDAVACGVLRLDKATGLPEYKDTSKTYEQDFNVFMHMLRLFYARHPRLRKGAGYEV